MIKVIKGVISDGTILAKDLCEGQLAECQSSWRGYSGNIVYMADRVLVSLSGLMWSDPETLSADCRVRPFSKGETVTLEQA